MRFNLLDNAAIRYAIDRISVGSIIHLAARMELVTEIQAIGIGRVLGARSPYYFAAYILTILALR